MIRTITRDELIRLMKSSEHFKLVDVLSGESYVREHIKGAISIPLDKIEEKAPLLLDRDEKIVTYCASFECQASTKAAEKLVSLGYSNVFDYKGGLKDYKEAGLLLEDGMTCVSGCCGCGAA